MTSQQLRYQSLNPKRMGSANSNYKLPCLLMYSHSKIGFKNKLPMLTELIFKDIVVRNNVPTSECIKKSTRLLMDDNMT